MLNKQFMPCKSNDFLSTTGCLSGVTVKCEPKFNSYLGFISVGGSCIQVVNPKPKAGT